MAEAPNTDNLAGVSPLDMAHEIDAVIGNIIGAVNFVERFPFFPSQYKSALDELLKVLTFAKALLDKV